MSPKFTIVEKQTARLLKVPNNELLGALVLRNIYIYTLRMLVYVTNTSWKKVSAFDGESLSEGRKRKLFPRYLP